LEYWSLSTDPYNTAGAQAHPGVPVVENLEDLWMVSKLQRERKAREAAAKRARLGRMQARYRPHPERAPRHLAAAAPAAALPFCTY